MGADLRLLGDNRAIDMVDDPAAISDQLRRVGEEAVGRRAAPLRVRRREMLADVAQPGRPEQRIGDRVEDDVGVAVAGQAARVAARLRLVVGRLNRVEALTGDFFEPDTSADEPPMPELAPETAEMVEGWRAYPALRSGRAQELFSRIEPQILARMSRAAIGRARWPRSPMAVW